MFPPFPTRNLAVFDSLSFLSLILVRVSVRSLRDDLSAQNPQRARPKRQEHQRTGDQRRGSGTAVTVNDAAWLLPLP